MQLPGAMMVAKIHDKTSMWLKAKVFRSGALGPVSRARVSDLLSTGMDRPAGPSQRVLQLAELCLLVGSFYIFALSKVTVSCSDCEFDRCSNAEWMEPKKFWRGSSRDLMLR